MPYLSLWESGQGCKCRLCRRTYHGQEPNNSYWQVYYHIRGNASVCDPFFYTNDRPLEISSGKYPYCGFLHHRNNKKNFVCQKRAVVCVKSHSFQIYAVDFAGVVYFPSSFLVPARASVVDFDHLHGSSRWCEQADWCPQLP